MNKLQWCRDYCNYHQFRTVKEDFAFDVPDKKLIVEDIIDYCKFNKDKCYPEDCKIYIEENYDEC